jgi:hypothetical protein
MHGSRPRIPVGSVNRNLKFRDTYNKVVENSQTAQRQAASNAMKPEVPLVNPNMTTIGFGARGREEGGECSVRRRAA